MTITTNPVTNQGDDEMVEIERLPVDPVDIAWIAAAFTVLAGAALTGWVAAGPVGLVGAGTCGLVAVVTADNLRGAPRAGSSRARRVP